MRKIIGFKVQARLREIQRRAKKAGQDPQAPCLSDAVLQPLLEKAAQALTPGVVFETFAHPDPSPPSLSPMPGLAYSLVLVTLGPALAPLRERSVAEYPALGPVWPLLEASLLDEAVRFATSLLEEEAAKESCELSPITPLAEPAALEAALRKLDGSKIGVSLEGGRLYPALSMAVSLSWLSKSKTKGKTK